MRRRLLTNVAPLLGYSAVSFLVFGVRLLPHPGRAILGTGGDAQIFIWSFAWWPHAIGAGENPFVSHAIFAPDGINLAWTTTVPGLAVAFWPLTALFGPVASYNVAAALMPALAAWTAYLLCRHVTGSLWASLVGGYLFGFSSYVLGQELGHLHMTSVFLVPLVALAVVRYVRGDLGSRGLAWRVGILLALQLAFSTELAFSLTLALAASLVLSFWLVRAARPRLRSLLRPLVSGYAIAAVLASPLLLYAAVGFESGAINEPSRFGSDLLNLVVPTRLVGIGGAYLADVSSRFPANDAERGAYLGLPTLVMVVWFAVRRRGSSVARFLVVALALSALVELGTSLVVDGRRVLALPWDLIARLPLLNNVLPGRFALFTSLAAAVIVALWIQSSRGLVAYALPALAVLALVPAVWEADFRSVPERWPFFTDGVYKTCLQRDENVLVFPYGPRGSSMLWQAESGFWFRMAEGYLRPKPPAAFLEHPTVQKLTYTADDPTPEEILSLARDKKVSRVLSVERYQHPSNDEMKRFGALQVVGGVSVAPACGNPPLAG